MAQDEAKGAMQAEPAHDRERDLLVTRNFEAQRGALWRAWTEPRLLMEWFTPAPWKTVDCGTELRPGGAFRWTMRSPQGEESTHEACYLAVVPDRHLVWTDALGAGFRPLASPFITVSIELSDVDSGTRQTCTILHRDAATRQTHLEKGFEQGWGTCLDQLAEVVRGMTPESRTREQRT